MPKRTLARWIVVLTLFSGASLRAQDDGGEALARQLLEVSGSAEIGKQVMEQMIGQMRQMAPGEVPEEFWTGVLERYDTGELVEKIVPIYTNHLSADQMAAAIEFYTSEHGQAIIEKMPMIMNESMMVGQEWGMAIAGEVMQDLQKMQTEATPASGADDAPEE